MKRLLAALLLPFAGLNVLAYAHARAFTRFTDGAARTRPPQELSLGQKLGVLLTGPSVPRPRNRRTPADVSMGYERHVFAGYRGTPLEAWLVPSETSRGTVVLFHGHAAAKDTLLRPAKVLHDMGWNALLVDFYGSGGSGGRETSIGFHEADDVASAAAYASELPGGRPVVLLGESMGAAAILKAMHAYDLPVQALILESPFDRLFVQQDFDAFGFNPVDDAAAVRCPTLLMNGARDPWVRPEEARAIYARLAGPKAFHEFADLGHQSFLSGHPSEWQETVAAFLASLVA